MMAVGSCQCCVSNMTRSVRDCSYRLQRKRTYPSPSGASWDRGMQTGSWTPEVGPDHQYSVVFVLLFTRAIELKPGKGCLAFSGSKGFDMSIAQIKVQVYSLQSQPFLAEKTYRP